MNSLIIKCSLRKSFVIVTWKMNIALKNIRKRLKQGTQLSKVKLYSSEGA